MALVTARHDSFIIGGYQRSIEIEPNKVSKHKKKPHVTLYVTINHQSARDVAALANHCCHVCSEYGVNVLIWASRVCLSRR